MRGRRRIERMLLGLGFRFGFGLGPFRSFLGLLDLVLEFGVEGLALLHGQLALLDKIVYDLLALFNGGRQSYRTFFTPALNETGQSS